MFIYRKEGALSPELCNSFIETFEESNEKKPGVLYGPEGHSSTSGKTSTDLTFHPGYLQHDTWGSLLQQLIPIVFMINVQALGTAPLRVSGMCCASTAR